MLNTNRELFSGCSYVQLFVQIPCWVGAPGCCLAGPLAASIHRQQTPAAAKHPREGDKHMPWCLLHCLWSQRAAPKTWGLGQRFYCLCTRFMLLQRFCRYLLWHCKGLSNNIWTVSHLVDTQQSVPVGDTNNIFRNELNSDAFKCWWSWFCSLGPCSCCCFILA